MDTSCDAQMFYMIYQINFRPRFPHRKTKTKSNNTKKYIYYKKIQTFISIHLSIPGGEGA